MFDPHVARNQCKLIWDSTAGPRHKLPVKKKVGFLNTSGGNVAAPVNQSRNLRRNSLVATRISFYEEKVDTETKEDGSPETREVQVKISFDDHATTTFEYEGEDSALETYLAEHPEERDNILKQDEAVNGDAERPAGGVLKDSTPVIPQEPETQMKSNTLIGTSGGELTSYKSKIQTQEFQFGMTPEPEVTSMPEPEPEDLPENVDFLPADESELDTFSAELEKTDMLF